MDSWTTVPAFWHAVTRLGEAQILLPACLAGLAWLALLARSRPAIESGTIGGRVGGAAVARSTLAGEAARDTAWRWALGLLLGTAVVTASKVAFIGYGIGSATLDFTGFSGHSMYATAVLPVLAALVAGRAGAACGFAVAGLVMVSRVVLHAHSWSEVAGGAMIGTPIASVALGRMLAPRALLRAPSWLPLLLAAWLTLLPWRAPPSRTHDWVIQLSLQLSGRPFPYTRAQMMWEARHHRARSEGGGPLPSL